MLVPRSSGCVFTIPAATALEEVPVNGELACAFTDPTRTFIDYYIQLYLK